jgi:hypothetical protein
MAKTPEDTQAELVATKRELTAALATITKLLKNMNEKDEKIKSLESLLSQRPLPIIKSVPNTPSKLVVNVSPEQQIAEMQLERIRAAATERTLTLEETRMYDLFVKNKRISQEEDDKAKQGNYRDVSDIELMKIASEAGNKDGSNS